MYRKDPHAVCRQRQFGQSAVETMFMIPVILLVFVGMYELFTLTFAAQNAHIRAREYVLHDGCYTPSSRIPPGESSGGGSVFDCTAGNYIIAERDIWGLSSGPTAPTMGWTGTARDQAIAGVVTAAGGSSGARVVAKAYICSPIGCP